MNSYPVLLGLLIAGGLALPLHAGDAGARKFNFNAREKLEKKESSRWTLQEWLAQKERNQLMDLWLAMYAPSPYEFFLKGASHSSVTTTDPITTEKSSQGSSCGIGAYATVIGLEGDYENNYAETYDDLSGSVNIRILGNAVQGTHLTAKYGLRTRHGSLGSGHSFRVGNQFAGGHLNLYITRYFGLQGLYHHYLTAEDPNLGTVSGSRSEAGAFIDFDIFRLYGNWFSDIQISELSGTTTTIQRTGTQIGLKIFF